MAAKHEIDLISLWKSATPLNDARMRYAPKALVEILDATPGKSTPDLILKLEEMMGLPMAERIPAMKASAAEQSERVGRRRDAIRAIDQHFMDKLAGKEFRCFAFEYPRRFDAKPVEILPEHWTAKPDWGKGELRHHGLHLIELRVVIADAAPEELPSTAPPPAGRPTFAVDILDAFAALRAKDALTVKPFSRGIEQIRSWIKENRPNSKAAQSKLSDDVVRNTLKPMLQAMNAERSDKL